MDFKLTAVHLHGKIQDNLNFTVKTVNKLSINEPSRSCKNFYQNVNDPCN